MKPDVDDIAEKSAAIKLMREMLQKATTAVAEFAKMHVKVQTFATEDESDDALAAAKSDVKDARSEIKAVASSVSAQKKLKAYEAELSKKIKADSGANKKNLENELDVAPPMVAQTLATMCDDLADGDVNVGVGDDSSTLASLKVYMKSPSPDLQKVADTVVKMMYWKAQDKWVRKQMKDVGNKNAS